MNSLTAIKENKAVIILDGLNFLFYEWQIEEALFLWESGVPLPEMVKRLRPVDTNLYQPYTEREAEVFLLLLHLSLEGKLKKRPGGVYGSWRQTRVED